MPPHPTTVDSYDALEEQPVAESFLKRRAEEETLNGQDDCIGNSRKRVKLGEPDEATEAALLCTTVTKNITGLTSQERPTEYSLKRKATNKDAEQDQPISKRIKITAADKSADATLKYRNKKGEAAKLALNRIRSRQHATSPAFQYTSKRSKLSLEEEYAENTVKLKAGSGELGEQAFNRIKSREHVANPSFKSEVTNDQNIRATFQRKYEETETTKPRSNPIESGKPGTKPLPKRKARDEHTAERTRKRNTPSSPASLLRRIPPEITEMIFNLCDMPWNGRSPAIIRALRQDPQLHAEAMRVFVKKENTFTLNHRNSWSFQTMSVKTILTIKKLKIEVQEYHYNRLFGKRKHQPRMIQKPRFEKLKPVCAWPINVREVTIEGAFCKVHRRILTNFDHYLAGFQQRLKTVTLDLRFDKHFPTREAVETMTARINKLFKVEWHLNKVHGSIRRSGKITRLTWCWEAPKEDGKFLRCIKL